MKSWFLRISALLMPALVIVPPLETAAAEATRFVAGLAPHQRPSGAPVVMEFVPGNDSRARSLTGVSEPIPASLGFLGHHGAWYTPFSQPGMPGPYDLRNWHHGVREPDNAGR